MLELELFDPAADIPGASGDTRNYSSFPSDIMRTTFEGKTFESCFSRWKLLFLFLSVAILDNFTCSQNVLFTSSILFLLSNLFLSLSPSLVYTQAQAIKRKKRRTSSDNCDPCYDAKFLFSYYARERRDERRTDERTNAFLSTRSFFSSSRPSSRL